MDPSQQPQQPPQPQPVPPPQPVPQPQQPIQQQPPQPIAPGQQVPQFQQPTVSGQGVDADKIFKMAGRSFMGVAIFYIVISALLIVIYGVEYLDSNDENALVMTLTMVFQLIVAIIFAVQGKKLKNETDVAKGAARTKVLAIVSGVVAATNIPGKAWLGALIFAVTSAYLFYSYMKVTGKIK